MLIKRNRIDKEKSQYKCDMCKGEINGVNRIAIYLGSRSNPAYAPKKKWDLCLKCYKIVNKNITNWSERK